MIFECDKCGYKSGKGKEMFGKTLCEFCSFFAPEEKEEYLIYVEEKVSAREIQTFRKQGKFGGIKQKKGMKKKASLGGVTSRAPYGYIIKDNKLIPAENSKEIEEIYTDFLNTSLSLNQFSKKHGFSYNGMKKILTNFTYLGKVKFGGEVFEGNHKPLISSTLFNHVQDKLEKGKIDKKLEQSL